MARVWVCMARVRRACGESKEGVWREYGECVARVRMVYGESKEGV